MENKGFVLLYSCGKFKMLKVSVAVEKDMQHEAFGI